MTALLDVKDLKVHFGGVKAVDGVSLSLQPGKIYGLVGSNGSGKTTMINAISRLTHITEGAVTFRGEDVRAQKPYGLSRIGLARTFQTIRLLDSLTVRENVMIGADHSRHATSGFRAAAGERARIRDAADEAIERLHLQAFAHHFPTSLSYGTQRRVEIARALASDPQLLLLDEPVAGMNRSERDEISDVIAGLRDGGLTQLLVEHDLRMVLRLSDHLYVMNFGRCIAEGDPRTTAALPEVQESYLGRRHDHA
jgi:ABC-type branched-subunit amino acid transport system ATPase component